MRDFKDFLYGLLFWLLFLACVVLGLYVIICYLCGYIPIQELAAACWTGLAG